MRAIAVDWSGAAHGARSHICLAEARAPGELVRLECGRDRDELCRHLLSLRPDDLVIGLDFAFSFPGWYLAQLGCPSAPELWAYVSGMAESWLAACEPPFWGRPGHPRPSLRQSMLRRTDEMVPRTSGIAPKSIFQI